MVITRTTVAIVTLILVFFVTTFIVLSHSKLSPASGTSSSRRTLRRRVKTTLSTTLTYTGYHHDHAVEQSDASLRASGKSEAEELSDVTEPRRRSPSSISAQTFESTRKTVVKDRSELIAAVPIVRPHNVTTRMYFRSPSRNRKSNETRMFKKRLKKSERVTLLSTFGAVTKALKARNVTFWMDGGTLLGSYRHHNLIPWDDDVDLILRRSQKLHARRAIKALAPAYQLYVENDAASSSELVWRVFASNGSVQSTRKKFRFPTVNLHFYSQNATHVWLEPHNMWWYFVWRKSIVFPLRLRPFAKYWAPAPCNTRAYLIAEYDPQVIDTCTSPKTFYGKNIGQRRTSVPCRSLNRVPVVNRKRNINGSVTETLVRGNKILRQRVVHQTC